MHPGRGAECVHACAVRPDASAAAGHLTPPLWPWPSRLLRLGVDAPWELASKALAVEREHSTLASLAGLSQLTGLEARRLASAFGEVLHSLRAARAAAAVQPGCHSPGLVHRPPASGHLQFAGVAAPGAWPLRVGGGTGCSEGSSRALPLAPLRLPCPAWTCALGKEGMSSLHRLVVPADPAAAESVHERQVVGSGNWYHR